MNNIRGLIIKDILQLKTYKKSIIISLILFIFCIITGNKEIDNIGGILIILVTLAFGMFSMASFNFDEVSKADKYILTLPLTKKEIILSKYILVASSTIIGALIGGLLTFFLTFIFKKQIPNFVDLVGITLGAILGIGLVESIQIPCVVKFGAEKGRIQMSIIIVAISAIIGGIIYILKKINVDLLIYMSPLMDFFNKIDNYIPFIMILSIFIIYYVSYKISYKIYAKKEL